MTQPAKGQEPSMEEILASIRRIIADDDTTRTPPKASEAAAAPPPPRMAPPPPPRGSAPPPEPERKEEDIDSMLAQLQATPRPAPAAAEEPASDILDLTEQMAAPPEEPTFRTIDGQQDVVFEDPPTPPPAPPPRPVAAPRRAAI